MLGLDAALVPSLADSRAAGRYRARRTVESREPGATRLRVDGRDVTAFCSNDYLGLADHPRVTEAFIEAARRWGVGSGAAHLVSGHCREHRLLEEALALFTGRPRALLFSTGYMANLAVIGAIAGRGDRVLEDRLNHASLLDAGLASGARFARYAHCDPASLEKWLGAAFPGTERRRPGGKPLRAGSRAVSRPTACSAWTAMSRPCASSPRCAAGMTHGSWSTMRMASACWARAAGARLRPPVLQPLMYLF